MKAGWICLSMALIQMAVLLKEAVVPAPARTEIRSALVIGRLTELSVSYRKLKIDKNPRMTRLDSTYQVRRSIGHYVF
jgi:hypothetical protein